MDCICYRKFDSSNVEEETKTLTLQLQHLHDQLESKKQQLGKIVRNVLQKERYMEQIPSRPELLQYQKRFSELYNQGCRNTCFANPVTIPKY